MTLATSSTIHQLQRHNDERQAEIRRNAERPRLNAWNVAALPLVYPKGVEDLTTPLKPTADSARTQRVASRRWSWRLTFGVLHLVGVKR
jgi:hypothetical protein